VPARAVRLSRSPVRRQRRRLEWADSLITFNAVANNTLQVFDLLANFVADGGSREGLTIIRTRIDASYAPSGTGDRSTLGLIVENVGAGAGPALMNPLSNPYEPWLLIKTLYPTSSGATVDATSTYTIDLKSKRKVQHVQETYWLTWITTAAANNSANFHVRALIALP